MCVCVGGGGGGGGGVATRAKIPPPPPPPPPPLKNNLTQLHANCQIEARIAKQGDEETVYSSCSACSVPKRQCQGMEISSSNVAQSLPPFLFFWIHMATSALKIVLPKWGQAVRATGLRELLAHGIYSNSGKNTIYF